MSGEVPHRFPYPVQDGKLVFSTDHFSYYAVMYAEPASGNGSGSGGMSIAVVAVIAVVALAVVAVAVVVVINKRKA